MSVCMYVATVCVYACVCVCVCVCVSEMRSTRFEPNLIIEVNNDSKTEITLKPFLTWSSLPAILLL